MIRWALKRIKILDTDGQQYAKDVEQLEMFVDGEWVSVPHVDVRFQEKEKLRR